ncbi:hypothetical protein AMECASPLE_006532, partial [Ameca splendens]
VVHYDRLKPYTTGLIPGLHSCTRLCPAPDSPSPQEDSPVRSPPDGCGVRLLVDSPPLALSRVGRAVRPPENPNDLTALGSRQDIRMNIFSLK